ncbi:MAG: tetratricopeptide repeat protein [Actinomycetota bacterium]
MLSGLVPGLPAELGSEILERAEGVPLYAMETVRMLLDRGLLVQEESSYRPAGPIEALEVPESLQALIAERLDGLASEERRLLLDASVLGRRFSVGALSALTGAGEADLRAMLDTLVRKEILLFQTDPHSPARGQYIFLQQMVSKVAYDRLSNVDRKARHLAAASHLSKHWRGGEEDETVEVMASHYLHAYRMAPRAPDAAEIKTKAGQMLILAAHRAASLGASQQAQAYFDRAAELADDALTKAGILEQAGKMAWRGGRGPDAEVRFEHAGSLFEAAGRPGPAARVSAHRAEVEWETGRLEEAIGRMEEAFRVLAEEHPDEDLAWVAAQLGRFYFHRGEMDPAQEHVETSLRIAGRLMAAEVLSQALVNKSLILNARGRPDEALGLMQHALEVAIKNDLSPAILRATRTLAHLCYAHDRYEEALSYSRDALDRARQLGDQRQEWRILSEMTSPFCSMGQWDEALQHASRIPGEDGSGTSLCMAAGSMVEIHVARGELGRVEEVLALAERCASSADIEERCVHLISRTRILRAAGREAEALSLAEEAVEARRALGMNPLGETPFWRAVTLLEHAEWLSARKDRTNGEALMAEAQDVFRQLRAKPFLERLRRAGSSGAG